MMSITLSFLGVRFHGLVHEGDLELFLVGDHEVADGFLDAISTTPVGGIVFELSLVVVGPSRDDDARHVFSPRNNKMTYFILFEYANTLA